MPDEAEDVVSEEAVVDDFLIDLVTLKVYKNGKFVQMYSGEPEALAAAIVLAGKGVVTLTKLIPPEDPKFGYQLHIREGESAQTVWVRYARRQAALYSNKKFAAFQIRRMKKVLTQTF